MSSVETLYTALSNGTSLAVAASAMTQSTVRSFSIVPRDIEQTTIATVRPAKGGK